VWLSIAKRNCKTFRFIGTARGQEAGRPASYSAPRSYANVAATLGLPPCDWQGFDRFEHAGDLRHIAANVQPAWISANGLITGWSQNGEIDPLVTGFPESHAVLWKDSKIRDLGTLPQGGYESLGLSVNNGGLVVGLATNTSIIG
jgi:hypothetical protein